MAKRAGWVALCVLIVAGLSIAQGRGQRGGAPAGPPDIVGAWSGTWSYWNPAQGAAPPREICAKLDANIVAKGEVWEATFEGDCGRPYKYSIKMEGRQAGSAVLFKGTVDLGPQDGGVYDWVGRATPQEFIGFYTSAMATGSFTMKRVPAGAK